MKKIIDLHIHTTCSDGELTPKEVIDVAIKNRVSVISITDHDTIGAYKKELFDYAKDNNIRIIPGVEISTKSDKCGIHVLGYNIDLNNKEFQNKLEKLRNSRHEYLYQVADKLNILGYIIDVTSLDKIEAVTKAHIALDVISNDKNKDILMREFGHIPNKGEFIETIMNEGCPVYVKKNTITPREAVELIEGASGVAVLAHPIAYKYEDNLTDEDISSLVNDMKVGMIEANYVYVDKNNKKINECDYWNKFAYRNNLKTTIGSDFHKDDGIRPVIGLIGEDIKLSDSEIDKIIANLEVE